MHIERELYADGRVLTRCNALLTLYRWGPGAEGASAPCGPCAVALAAERARDERGDP